MLAVVITRAPIAALAIAAALGLGACTSSSSSEDSAKDFQGEQRRVAQVIEDLEDAGGKRDADDVCQDLLATKLVRAIAQASGESCANAVDDALGDVDADDVVVEKVRVTGTTASATVRGEGGDDERTDTLTLTKERGRWRISGLGS